MAIRPFHRFGRKVLLGSGAFTSVLLGWTGSGALCAQQLPTSNAKQPAAVQEAAPAPRNYLNKNTIQLPIRIDESSRSQIQEIHLYVKDHPNSPWTKRDQVGPTQKAFTFQVPRDGEYWFAMVTVDKQGRSFPADLRNQGPELIVVIDTQMPRIELTNLGNSPDGQLIQCDVEDANVDVAKTRLFFQGGDSVFRPLEAVPGRKNVFCIPAQAVCTGLVRVTAGDLAGNQDQRELNLNQLATTRPPAPAFPPQPAVQPTPQPAVQPPPQQVVQQTPMKTPINFPPMTLPSNVITAPELPVTEPQPKQKPSSVPIPREGTGGPRLPGHTSGSSPISQPPATPAVQQTKHQEPLKRQVVNSTKVFLDYQVENAGQSGVGKVEVWITSDRARSWQRLSEDTRHKSPIEIQFPSEGLFGVTLVASNGRGVSAPPPAAGDTPDWWIEVDTTKPTAQITKIHSATENGKAVVQIHWTTQDKNLGDSPVDLLYAATPQGPWLPIAKGLKGEGQYRWTPPVEIGVQAHVRLSVSDAAGNTSIVGTLTPVLFEESARPRALIRGISTGAPSSTPTPVPNATSPSQIVLPPPLPLGQTPGN